MRTARTDTVRRMRPVRRPWSLLVLLAVLALGGPTATASASDVGLRTLVSEQRALEKAQEARIETTGDRLADAARSATSPAQAGRRLAQACRSFARQLRQARRGYDTYRTRFEQEAPETNEAAVGQRLMVRGLREGSASLRRAEGVMRRAAARFGRARTASGIGRVGERFEREYARAYSGDRSGARLKRGRTLIRNAPAVPAPAA